jgi:hypothetical protein
MSVCVYSELFKICEYLTLVNIKIATFWNVKSCSSERGGGRSVCLQGVRRLKKGSETLH